MNAFFSDSSDEVRATLIAAGVFVLAVLVFWAFARFLIQHLKTFTRHGRLAGGAVFLEAVPGPLRLLLVSAALQVALPFAPVHIRNAPHSAYVSKVFAIIALFWLFDRFSRGMILRSAKPLFARPHTQALSTMIVRVLVFATGTLVLLDTLGISITPLLASLGVGSLAVALALQDTLSHFFSGVYLLVDRPIAVGDHVRLDGGFEGTVREIGWRNTRVELFSGHEVIVPNSKIASSPAINLSLPTPETPVVINMRVSFTNDPASVEQAILQVANEVQRSTPGAVIGFQPVVRFSELNETDLKFVVVMRANTFTDQGLIIHEFLKRAPTQLKTQNIRPSVPSYALTIES